MAQCKDCLYHEMCYHTHTSASPICEDFKDKERYREQSEGEWLLKGVYFKRLECSACNCTADSIYARTPYCPFCGAKMKGERNDKN